MFKTAQFLSLLCQERALMVNTESQTVQGQCEKQSSTILQGKQELKSAVATW